MAKTSPGESDGPRELLTIAVSATFTADPVERTLAFWFAELDIPVRVVFAPHNQVFQELLDSTSLLGRNQTGVNVVLVRLEDWGDWAAQTRRGSASEQECQGLERSVREFCRAVTTAVERSPIPHLIVVCPGSPAGLPDPRRARLVQEMEHLLGAELAAASTVELVTTADLSETYPVAEYHDSHAEELADMPYTPVFFAALGTMIARRIHAGRDTRYKVIALDCDQTLWTGACGEDGPSGVVIDASRRAIQDIMVRQHDMGRLLCVCSKNNEPDVAEVFAQRSDMVLKREHIVAWRVNWRPKSENLRSLADELGLGLDSVIFIDDDPVECAEVEANCPDVLTIQLPRSGANLPRFLNHLWVLDRVSSTRESGERTKLYREHAERERLRREGLTLADFLGALGLRICIAPVTSDQAARVAELTQRTNQFNVTGIKRSGADIRWICESGGMGCLGVGVKDRFGDYGLVGVMLFRVAPQTLAVDTFLLSCRALGRGVEHRMLARLGAIAVEQGVDRVDVPYVATGRNRPAEAFLHAIAGEFKERSGNDFVFRIPAGVAAAATYRPPTAEGADQRGVEGDAPARSVPGAGRDARATAVLFSSIALALSNAEAIERAVASRRRRHAGAAALVPPRTPVERQLAEVWSEVLGLDRVGVEDDFFELGGHSLQAMQILSRVHQAFGVELSLRLVFGGAFTVAALARAVLGAQMRWARPADVSAVLEEVAALSDEEVRTLLERPRGGSETGSV